MNDELWEEEVRVRSERAGRLFSTFVRTIASLRHPVRGCPWDLQQDHKSLRRFMLEEAYEASVAMLSEDSEDLLDELGDVLLQVVLNAQVSFDSKKGDICQVLEKIDGKMVRRHPHVFGSESGQSLSVEEIKANWSSIKKSERAIKSGQEEGLFSDLVKVIPALTQAYKIGQKTAEIGFDWHDAKAVIGHFKSEIEELENELSSGEGNQDKILDELGDVFFTLAQVSRHLGIEPEAVAQRGNQKFLNRFKRLEDLAGKKGLSVRSMKVEALEALWQQAKRSE